MILSLQTVTEKHKLNVPETMTEVLDVSDEEGEQFLFHITLTRLRIAAEALGCLRFAVLGMEVYRTTLFT